jgi:hypothetical protein
LNGPRAFSRLIFRENRFSKQTKEYTLSEIDEKSVEMAELANDAGELLGEVVDAMQHLITRWKNELG